MLSAAQLYLSTPNAHTMAKIKDMDETIISYISVTIAFITFLGIIAFHIYERVKKQRKIKEAIHKMKEKLKKKKPSKNETTKSTSVEIRSITEESPTDLRDITEEFPTDLRDITEEFPTDLREPLLDSLN